jgi:hypothetical protein
MLVASVILVFEIVIVEHLSILILCDNGGLLSSIQ